MFPVKYMQDPHLKITKRTTVSDLNVLYGENMFGSISAIYRQRKCINNGGILKIKLRKF